MQICNTCHKEKPYDSFYLTSSKCKECTSEYQRNYKARINSDPEKRAEYLRKKREYGMANRSSWAKPDIQTAREYHRRYLNKYPEKRAAHRAFRKALKSGKIQKQPCEICGTLPADGHHDDYSKKLSVRWLCRKHHEEHHHGRVE
jgi:hypothetical protein